MKSSKHQAKRLGNGSYEYRGMEIYRGDEPQGYYGAWRVMHSKISEGSLRNVRLEIDRKLDCKPGV